MGRTTAGEFISRPENARPLDSRAPVSLLSIDIARSVELQYQTTEDL